MEAQHTSYGPGLRLQHDGTWYGGGYCGICGHRGEDLVPRAVRWWDPDDGWRRGVLCTYCGEEQVNCTPGPDDYASLEAERQETRARGIDLLSEMLGDDQDGADALAADLL